MGLRGIGAHKSTHLQGDLYARGTDDDLFGHREPWSNPTLTRAEQVITFVEMLPVVSGPLAGTNIRLLDFQRDFLHRVYSDKPVRQALLSIPRKNGKTALAAALCLAHLVGPEKEEMNEVYSAAADKQQAAIIFRMIERMSHIVPWLGPLLNIKRHEKVIECEDGSFFRALSAEVGTKHGLNPTFVVYDELAQARDRELYDVLQTAGGARESSILMTISTQSEQLSHVLTELTEYGNEVNKGLIDDPSFVSLVCQADEDDDPFAEETWYKANPALGVFRSLDEFRSSAEQAKRVPSRLPAFLNLYLNMPVEADPSFLPVQEWVECAGEPDYSGPCYAGMDLAQTLDLNAIALYWPETGAVKIETWVPQEFLSKREDTDRVPYRAWDAAGWLHTTPGRAVDKSYIAHRFREMCSKFDLKMLAVDRWGLAEFERVLNDAGGSPVEIVPFGQGYKDMSPAIAALEELIISRKLVHDGNPLATWTMQNLVTDIDPAGNRKFTKARAKERIDPMIALVMAVGTAAKESTMGASPLTFATLGG